MQIKPFFKDEFVYKKIKYINTDDRGHEYYFCFFKGLTCNGKVEKFYKVCDSNKKIYTNKAVAYDDDMYWKKKKNKLMKKIVGFNLLIEKHNGDGCFFGDYPGPVSTYYTKFEVYNLHRMTEFLRYKFRNLRYKFRNFKLKDWLWKISGAEALSRFFGTDK